MYVDEETKAKAQKLYDENIKMATHWANKFSIYIKYGIYDYEDLLQTAQLSLWKACLTFDDTKGHKFFTYASRCLSNDLIMFKNKSFKEDREDYISYNNEIKDDQDSTYLDVLLGDQDLEGTMNSDLFITDIVDKLKDYYRFEEKDTYIPIVEAILNHYSLKELVDIFEYDRKSIKYCFETLKYVLDKGDNNLDVMTVKVRIYRGYPDFLIKARKSLKEHEPSKDGSKEGFKYYMDAEKAFIKLKDDGYSILVSSLLKN